MTVKFIRDIRKMKLVYVYFVDRNRTFFPQVKERLANEEKYTVHLFSTTEILYDHLKTLNPDDTSTNIIFLNTENAHYGNSGTEKLIENVKKIKSIHQVFNIFVLTNQKDLNTLNDLTTAGALRIIPKNDNSVHRIINYIKGLISEKNLEKKRKATILPLKILLIFVLLIIILAIIAYIIQPEIFYS